jgi:Fic family protein
MFDTPLPNQEVKSIGKSIATWTWRHLSEKGFSDYQRRAAIRGRAIATKKAESRDIQIRMFKGNNPKMSNRAIAKVFKVSEFTVRNALKNKSKLLF